MRSSTDHLSFSLLPKRQRNVCTNQRNPHKTLRETEAWDIRSSKAVSRHSPSLCNSLRNRERGKRKLKSRKTPRSLAGCVFLNPVSRSSSRNTTPRTLSKLSSMRFQLVLKAQRSSSVATVATFPYPPSRSSSASQQPTESPNSSSVKAPFSPRPPRPT